METDDRLPVDDLPVTHPGERLGERDAGDLGDRLVELPRMGTVREAACQEQMYPLIAEARRGEHPAEVPQLARHDAGLLGKHALGPSLPRVVPRQQVSRQLSY